MAKCTVERLGRDVQGPSALLASPEVRELVADLTEARCTARPGYQIPDDGERGLGQLPVRPADVDGRAAGG
jgi:hypothetical protein